MHTPVYGTKTCIIIANLYTEINSLRQSLRILLSVGGQAAHFRPHLPSVQSDLTRTGIADDGSAVAGGWPWRRLRSRRAGKSRNQRYNLTSVLLSFSILLKHLMPYFFPPSHLWPLHSF